MPKVWDFVQDILKNRPKYNHHIFSSKIVCSSCGAYYGPKTWHFNTKYRRTTWRCNKKYTKTEEPCKIHHLRKENIKNAFVDSVNDLIANKEHILEDLKMVVDIFDTSQLQVSLELSIDKSIK